MGPGNGTLAVLSLSLLALPASAGAHPWHLGIEAGTDMPVDLGVRVTVEGPLRLRLSTSIGYVPEAYVGLINSVATSAGWYTDQTATLIRTALQRSAAWRTHLGWRPFRRHGLYIAAGYGLVFLGGGASGQELMTGVVGYSPMGAASTNQYEVSSALHMIDAEVGWEFLLFRDRVTLGVALGFAGTVGSSTRVEPAFQPRFPQAMARFTADAEQYLDTTYRSYVFTGALSLWAGYRFF